MAQDELLRRTVFGYELRWAERKFEINWTSTQVESYSGNDLKFVSRYQCRLIYYVYPQRPSNYGQGNVINFLKHVCTCIVHTTWNFYVPCQYSISLLLMIFLLEDYFTSAHATQSTYLLLGYLVCLLMYLLANETSTVSKVVKLECS